MTTRRDFLKLGSLFVPVVAAPTVAHSFLRAPGFCVESDQLVYFPVGHYADLIRRVAAAVQLPEYVLRGHAATGWKPYPMPLTGMIVT